MSFGTNPSEAEEQGGGSTGEPFQLVSFLGRAACPGGDSEWGQSAQGHCPRCHGPPWSCGHGQDRNVFLLSLLICLPQASSLKMTQGLQGHVQKCVG